MSDDSPATKQRKRTTRSPQYPAFGLRVALARARDIYGKEQFHRVNYKTAIADMGLSSGGSTGIRALSALLQFGILTEQGKGDTRQVEFSREAKQILLDERDPSPERDAHIRALARKPAIYADLLREYGPSLPSDAEVKLWLVSERGYNRESVGDLIAAFKDTVVFAKLDSDGAQEEIGGEPADYQTTSPQADPFAMLEEARRREPPRNTRGGGVGGGHAHVPTKGEQPLMPETDTNSDPPWDIPIPLVHGTAILRVPQPLTEENLELLKEAVNYQISYAQRLLKLKMRNRGETGGGA